MKGGEIAKKFLLAQKNFQPYVHYTSHIIHVLTYPKDNDCWFRALVTFAESSRATWNSDVKLPDLVGIELGYGSLIRSVQSGQGINLGAE